jgi:hypothetical protein
MSYVIASVLLAAAGSTGRWNRFNWYFSTVLNTTYYSNAQLEYSVLVAVAYSSFQTQPRSHVCTSVLV